MKIAGAGDFKTLLNEAQRVSDLMKALSHESRLLILCALAEGERSVSDLEEITAMSQAATSQQLARLRMDGLVTTRRDGRVIYYSIASEEISRMIESLYEFFCKPLRDAKAQDDNDALASARGPRRRKP